MKNITIKKIDSFNATINNIASDKSISHRSAIFSLLSSEISIIKNYLLAEDTLNTLKIIQQLGAEVKIDNNIITITPPKDGIKEPDDILNCGNSGTAIRIFCGLLSSVDGFFVLSGDRYIRKRPMKRVIKPLIELGAKIDARDNQNLAPISIRGGNLKPFRYESKISSAQVKTAMILAGLNAQGKSYYKEIELSRDHTERMLKGMGAELKEDNGFIEITPLKQPLKPLNLTIPADPSSGFFFAILASIIPNSKIVLKNTTLNPTRIEAYHILKQMGAKINFIKKEDIYEPIGDIVVEYNGRLKATKVDKNISWLIDELPALSVAFCVADGISSVKNAKELRKKESDRIKTVVDNLNLAGVKTKEYEDGYEVVGTNQFKSGAVFDSCGDHRIAMSFIILSKLIGDCKIKDIECIETSFPNFLEILDGINNEN